MRDGVPAEDERPEQRWLHLQNAKKLAKVVKRSAVVLHSRALNGVCRSAGYVDYSDALQSPRPVPVSFEEWKRRLDEEFDRGGAELLPPDELLKWFGRVFVERGWEAAQLRRGSHIRSIDAPQPDLDDDEKPVPLTVDHERTMVDGLWRKTRGR